MIKELLATTLLAGAVGSAPLMAYNPDTLNDNGWLTIRGDGQKGSVQVLLNDGRQHRLNPNATAFDELCYYVANWWSNERVVNAQNYSENTRLLGFYTNDAIVFTEYVTRFSFPFYSCVMRNYKNNEQSPVKNTATSTLPLSQYMFSKDEQSGYYINDDGNYIYGNFNDILNVQENLYYVRGDDVFFRTDVLCSVDLQYTWDDFVGYVYHDDDWRIGYNAGLENGTANGRITGYNDGYTSGYNSGYNDAKTEYDTNDSGVFGLVSQSFTAVSSFLNLHVAPNITLGMLLSIPIIVAIVFVVIKFVKG